MKNEIPMNKTFYKKNSMNENCLFLKKVERVFPSLIDLVINHSVSENSSFLYNICPFLVGGKVTLRENINDQNSPLRRKRKRICFHTIKSLIKHSVSGSMFVLLHRISDTRLCRLRHTYQRRYSARHGTRKGRKKNLPTLNF